MGKIYEICLLFTLIGLSYFIAGKETRIEYELRIDSNRKPQIGLNRVTAYDEGGIDYSLNYIITNTPASDITIWNNTLYVVTDSDFYNVSIFDISNPKEPIFIASFLSTIGTIDNIQVKDGYAYVIERSWIPTYYFSIYDVRNPNNVNKIYEKAYLSTYDLCITQDFVYVTFITAAFDSFIAIYNISDPHNPISTGNITLNNEGTVVFTDDNWLYVGLRANGIAIINISNPLNFGTPIYNTQVGTVHRIFVNNHIMYLSDDNGYFLSIYDGTNKSDLTLLQKWGGAHQFTVWANNNLAFIQELTFMMLDIINMTNSTILFSIEDLTLSAELTFYQGFVYSACGHAGVAIIEIQGVERYIITSHMPIQIDGNSDFHMQATTEGWNLHGERTGNITHPYLIQSYEIQNSTANLIEIMNTDVYFKITYNQLNGLGSDLIGISFQNVTHGSIIRNTITNLHDGIYLRESSYNYILKNDIFNTSVNGMTLYLSHKNIVCWNMIHNNTYSGIHLMESEQNIIMNNDFNYNNDTGIFLEFWSKNNTIFKNTISHSQQGIYLIGSDYSFLQNNTISNNDYGIRSVSSFTTIIENNFLNNTKFGILLYEYVNKDSIKRNNFIFNNINGTTQAMDNGSNNIFNSSYWSDWLSPDSDYNGIVDNPYLIDGLASSRDNYPHTVKIQAFDVDYLTSPSIITPRSNAKLLNEIEFNWIPAMSLANNPIYYSLFYSVNDITWFPIITDLTEANYIWNISMFKGGNYRIKLIATNGKELITEDSVWVTIEAMDSYPPEIDIQGVSEGETYSHLIQLTVTILDESKIGSVVTWLTDSEGMMQSFLTGYNLTLENITISSWRFRVDFNISLLSDGAALLSIEVFDVFQNSIRKDFQIYIDSGASMTSTSSSSTINSTNIPSTSLPPLSNITPSYSYITLLLIITSLGVKKHFKNKIKKI